MQKHIQKNAVEAFAQMFKELPPFIARKKVDVMLGGLISSKTLANADSAGKGPKKAMIVGGSVCYPKESLVDWLSARGVSWLSPDL